MVRFVYAFFCLVMFGYSVVIHAQQPLQGISSEKITITSVPSINPVLKRLDANPLLCIKIYVPAKSAVNYKKIQVSINAEGIESLDKLEVFFNGSEPLFSAKNAIASISP